jgi:hypothetical protein
MPCLSRRRKRYGIWLGRASRVWVGASCPFDKSRKSHRLANSYRAQRKSQIDRLEVGEHALDLFEAIELGQVGDFAHGLPDLGHLRVMVRQCG